MLGLVRVVGADVPGATPLDGAGAAIHSAKR